MDTGTHSPKTSAVVSTCRFLTPEIAAESFVHMSLLDESKGTWWAVVNLPGESSRLLYRGPSRDECELACNAARVAIGHTLTFERRRCAAVAVAVSRANARNFGDRVVCANTVIEGSGADIEHAIVHGRIQTTFHNERAAVVSQDPVTPSKSQSVRIHSAAEKEPRISAEQERRPAMTQQARTCSCPKNGHGHASWCELASSSPSVVGPEQTPAGPSTSPTDCQPASSFFGEMILGRAFRHILNRSACKQGTPEFSAICVLSRLGKLVRANSEVSCG